jgi:hypothetical protein
VLVPVWHSLPVPGLHELVPSVQVGLHLPPLQVEVLAVSQWFPHVPQLLLSLLRSAQQALQVPLQSSRGDGQWYEQLPPAQLPTLPPVPWLHIESLQQAAQQALQTLPPQSLVPCGQVPATQVPLLQTPGLSPTLGHWLLVQQALHVPSAHRCKLALHLRSHVLPSQVAVALGEVGQASHELPQELTLRSSRQAVPHS